MENQFDFVVNTLPKFLPEYQINGLKDLSITLEMLKDAIEKLPPTTAAAAKVHYAFALVETEFDVALDQFSVEK